MASASENLKVEDDGLVCAPVHRWDQLVYIDLYAGGGFSHVRGTRTFLKGLTRDCANRRLPVR